MTFIQYSEALSTAGRDDDGKIKTNQDSYVLERNINGVLNYNILGVMDGHGVNGHFASQFVTKFIINRIKNHSLLKNLDNPKDIYNKLKSNKFQIITNIFLDADLQIRKQKFNVEMSGTTAVLVIELDEHIICANTGDSRAILVYDDSNDKKLSSTKIFHLSIDAKPDLPEEKKRIYECGGVVEQVIDETDETVGPYRIWKKGETYPGLAISRTIGDSDAKKIGVIANPEFIEYTITPQTKYIIACSDGIWEFLKNEEVMKIANEYYLKNDPAGLCHELTNKSTANWLKEDVVVDDITVVAAFF
jgi:serine/threonine protein phosphatase PrpC